MTSELRQEPAKKHQGEGPTRPSAEARTAPPALDHAAIRTIIFGIMLAMLLAALEQTIVATALPTIGRVFGDLENLSWVVTAYLVCSTAATPLYGKLSDIYGRRAMLLVGIGIFVLGSIACALAPNMGALILARGLQGLGGGGLISLAQTIVADVVPPRERGRYQAYFASVFVTASVAGPVLGGVIAEHLHWSVIFWINLPLGALALAMTYTILRRLPVHHRPHRIDLWGALLMVAAAVTFLLALTWGGSRYPWVSPMIIGLLLGSAALWALFALRLATAEEPFLPIAILRHPVIAAASIGAFLAMGTLIGLSVFAPLYFELVLHLTASQSGLTLIPLMAGVVGGATGAGRLMMRIRHYKRPTLVGLALSVLALLPLILWPGRLSTGAVAALLGLVGLGLGTVLPVATVAAQNAVPPHQLGTATGLMGFVRALGGAVAVALFGAILLAGAGVRPHSGAGLEELLAEAATRGVDVAGLFRAIFAAAAVALCLAFAAMLMLEERPLRGRTSAQPSPAE